MANIIQIKRSNATTIPSSLAEGELAYAETAGVKLLYIGTNAGTNVETIGGKSIVDKVNTISPSATANQTDATLLSRSNHTGTQTAATISNFTSSVNSNTLVSGAIQTSQKGVANGVATLDSNSLIPTSQLPAIAISNTTVVASQVAMLAVTAQVGDIVVRTDLNKSYILSATPSSTLSNWQELISPTSAVTSVNSQTGVIILASTDIAEGSNLYYTEARVSANTTVSANTSARHTHSNSAVLNATTASFLTAEKSKLTGVATGATSNSTDAALLSRSNHTGTQLAATISDFTAASTAVIGNATINGGTF